MFPYNQGMEPNVYIRLFTKKNGKLYDTREDFSSRQMGGQIPNVGDIIVSPWLKDAKQDLPAPARRTFYEVIGRYIHPRDDPDLIRIALVVVCRLGTEEEREIL